MVLAVAAVAALGVAGLTTVMNRSPDSPSAPEQQIAGPEQPRRVRTVPITVAPTPSVDTPPVQAPPAAVCRTFEMEAGPEGASLLDAPLGGQPVARLTAGEKVNLRQVVELGPARLIEVEVPARSTRGFIAERELRLPVMAWTCDR